MPTKSNSNCFDWRTYQVDDLAAAALVDGLIYCWEPGLGKSLAAFAWPILKGSKLNLLVAPGSLHDQLKKEGLEKFGVTVKDLPNQATFYADPVLQRRWISGELPEEAH